MAPQYSTHTTHTHPRPSCPSLPPPRTATLIPTYRHPRRYLELLEFCVALLQAPAEAVTQTVVYAQQNRMGGGMYLNHALFLASISLSLCDCLIATCKLVRWAG